MTGLAARPAPAGLEDVIEHIDRGTERWIERLSQFIQRPSRTGIVDEVRVCGEWFAEVLRGDGWTAELVDPGHGAPVVLATQPGPAAGPHLLLYSHYDVISPEPMGFASPRRRPSTPSM